MPVCIFAWGSMSAQVYTHLSLSLMCRPAGPADRPDKGFRLSGGGETAAALRPLRVSPASRGHRGWIRPCPRQTHREVHPQDQEVCVCMRGTLSCFPRQSIRDRSMMTMNLLHLSVCRKEQWGQSVCQVWSVLLTQTRLESREHAALGDTCCNTLTQQLTHSTEDTHRLHKRVSGWGVKVRRKRDRKEDLQRHMLTRTFVSWFVLLERLRTNFGEILVCYWTHMKYCVNGMWEKGEKMESRREFI